MTAYETRRAIADKIENTPAFWEGGDGDARLLPVLQDAVDALRAADAQAAKREEPLRLEALRLAANVEESREDVALRAELYRRFLTDTVLADDLPTPNARRLSEKLTAAAAVNCADATVKAARINYTSKSGRAKVDVYAQIMAIVHESGVFTNPVLLASEIGRVIIEANATGE